MCIPVWKATSSSRDLSELWTLVGRGPVLSEARGLSATGRVQVMQTARQCQCVENICCGLKSTSLAWNCFKWLSGLTDSPVLRNLASSDSSEHMFCHTSVYFDLWRHNSANQSLLIFVWSGMLMMYWVGFESLSTSESFLLALILLDLDFQYQKVRFQIPEFRRGTWQRLPWRCTCFSLKLLTLQTSGQKIEKDHKSFYVI